MNNNKVMFRRNNPVIDTGQSAELLDIASSQKYLNIGRRVFNTHVRPNLPTFRIGKKIYFKKRDINEFIDRIARDNRF